MAMTNAEKVRAYRERQKANAKAALTNAPVPADYVRGSFAAFVGDRLLMLDENLDAFGVQIAGRDFLTTEVQDFPSQHVRETRLTALQRAVGLVDVFLDAAQELADLVNAFKLQEISKAIEDAVTASANSPRGDVAALKAALAEIDRLKAIQADLQKPTRHTEPATRAKGE